MEDRVGIHLMHCRQCLWDAPSWRLTLAFIAQQIRHSAADCKSENLSSCHLQLKQIKEERKSVWRDPISPATLRSAIWLIGFSHFIFSLFFYAFGYAKFSSNVCMEPGQWPYIIISPCFFILLAIKCHFMFRLFLYKNTNCRRKYLRLSFGAIWETEIILQ